MNDDTNTNATNDPLATLLAPSPAVESLVCEDHDMRLLPHCPTCVEDNTQRRVYAAVQEAERKFEDWKEHVTDQAHMYADDNNLCEAFDDFMENQGLRRRTHSYTVTVRVTLDVDIEVDAKNERDAENQIESSEVYDAIEIGREDWSVYAVSRD